jgi:CheY-like chemotaxis protein
MRKLRALIVDDVVDMALAIAKDLALIGFETDIATSGHAALDRFAKWTASICSMA